MRNIVRLFPICLAFSILLWHSLSVGQGSIEEEPKPKTPVIDKDESVRDTIKTPKPEVPQEQDTSDGQDTLVVGDSVIATDSTAIDSAAAIVAPLHKSVGARHCRICHKDEYISWLATPHARAYDRLDDEEKHDPECIDCHTSGKDKNNALLRGVQCEACHGPGADYSKTKIMTDKSLAEESGLFKPNEEMCVRCHNERSPTFKGFIFKEAVTDTTHIHQVFEHEKRKRWWKKE